MNEFKINVYYDSESSSFQEVMNELFLLFIKNKLMATCSINFKELQYNR